MSWPVAAWATADRETGGGDSIPAGTGDVRVQGAQMRFQARFWTRFRQRRGQSITEYSLVIAAVALVALFTGYQQLANIVVSLMNGVVSLF